MHEGGIEGAGIAGADPDPPVAIFREKPDQASPSIRIVGVVHHQDEIQALFTPCREILILRAGGSGRCGRSLLQFLQYLGVFRKRNVPQAETGNESGLDRVGPSADYLYVLRQNQVGCSG